MQQTRAYETSRTRRFIAIMMAFMLVMTGFPPRPAAADPETGPMALPIYVGWEQFSHTGENANAASDGSRMLNFPSQSSPTNSASTSGGRLRVTPATNYSTSGIVVRTNKIKLVDGFSTYFVMNLHSKTSTLPADGLTFIIQDNPTPRIGGVGIGVGYAGIPNSIGVEFDIWVNNENGYQDPNANHVAIVKDGVNSHSVNPSAETSIPEFNLYGNTVHVWVDYDGNGVVTTSYGLTKNRSQAETFSRNVGDFLTDKEVYVGFGASTGSANAHHDVLAWYFKETYVPGGLDPDGDYKQGPSAVTIDPINGKGVSIKVKGISTSQNLPNEKVDIYIRGNKVSGNFETDADGNLEYMFDASSGLQAGNNTITVVSQNGGTSGSINIVGTAAPSPNDIVANATDQVVTVSNVPNGVTVTLTDDEGNVIGTSANVTGGKVEFDVEDFGDYILSKDSPINVTYSKTNEYPGTVSITPKVRSDELKENDIFANATKNVGEIDNVPTGAIVRIYDAVTNALIGDAQQNGADGTLQVPLNIDLADLQHVDVTIQKVGELESYPLNVEAKLETSTAPVDPTANADTDTIIVNNVPSGARVIVYTPSGEELASEVNRTGETSVMEILMSPFNIRTSDEFLISIHELDKYESNKVSTQGKHQSETPEASKAQANATTDKVTVRDVPAKAVVRVYDNNGELIGEGSNEGDTDASVIVNIEAPGLEDEQEVLVTIQEAGELESGPSKLVATFDTTAAPTNVKANATEDRVFVKDVPEGATVNVYVQNGDGSFTLQGSSVSAGDEVEVEITELTAGDVLHVSVTERDKKESDKVTVTAKDQTPIDNGPLDDENIDVDADGTNGEVTVRNVPPGSTIIVYDEDGKELGRGTNTDEEDPDTVVIKPVNVDVKTDSKIYITIMEEGKLESEPVEVEVSFEKSGEAQVPIKANSTTDTVIVDNVPGGTTVNVYDTNGDLIGTAKNTSDDVQSVTVDIESGLADNQEVIVKLAEPHKLESDGRSVVADIDAGEELNPDSIEANATKNTVTVRDVPPGGTITVYDDEGNNIGTATNNGSEPQDVTVNIDSEDALSEGDRVDVTITLPPYGESPSVEVEAKLESSALNVGQVVADGTKGEVTVSDVPVGATVIIYDKDGNELGRITNPGPGTEVVIHTDALKPGEDISVTITEEGKLESERVQVSVSFNQSSAPDASGIEANASNNTVKVDDVPAGAIVKIYGEDSNGDPIVIGTAVNEEAADGTVTVSIPDGLKPGDLIQVSITEPNKTESELSDEVVAKVEQSEALKEEDIKANATDNTVTVSHVPPGSTVTVYANDGVTVIGTATNESTVTGDVIVRNINPALNTIEDEDVLVSITWPEYEESTTVSVNINERTSTDDLEDIVADGTNGEVIVSDVPPGATITVYDKDGNVLGTATNDGTDPAELVIELDGLNPEDDEVLVTITAPGLLESEKVEVKLQQSTPPSVEDLAVNATNDTVTVKNVPPGATVNVYDENHNYLGTVTNEGTESGDMIVKIPGGLTVDQKILVTINEPYKSESETTPAVAKPYDSDALEADDIEANVTKNTVTVRDVPPGATINVYDSEGNKIGTATNNGSEAGPVVVTIDEPYQLGEGDAESVQVTITLEDGDESEKVEVAAKAESNKLTPGAVSASSSTSEVKVADVPPGAIVYVYDEDGNLIGTAVNSGGDSADFTISITPKLTLGQTVTVTIQEVGKLESEPLSVTAAMDKSAAPLPANLKANASTSRITVSQVPAGATARIYDQTGKLVATRKNTTASAIAFDFQVTPAFAANAQFDISLQELNKLESDRVPVVALAQSAAPSLSNEIDVDVSKDTVTITNVPPGTTVIIYDDKGNPIGSATNNSDTVQDVTIETDPIVTQAISVTFTEEDKHESSPLVVDIELSTDEAIDDALRRLTIGYQAQDTWESVTLPVFVVTAGAHGTDVAWSSGKQHIIEITTPVDATIEALVHRQSSDESVILTATVSKNGQSKSRTFLLNVMAASLTKTVNSNYRTVNVVGGENEDVTEQVDIERVTMSNGLKIDKAIFDAATAGDLVNNPLTNDKTASIIVDEVENDEADEYAIEIPRQSVELLNGNGNSLEIRTEYGILSITASVLGEMNESFLDLFFRLVPLKDEDRQEQLNRSIVGETVVRDAAAGKIAEVIGSSMTIETNYSGYATTLIIPFAKNGIVVPDSNTDSFLNSLRVYIEHSDGEKVVQTGTIVNKDGRPYGISIDINKFSTFSILRLKDAPVLPQLPATDGKEQVKTSTADPKAGTIVVELDKSGYSIDKTGFTVTVGGKPVEIEDIIIDGDKVTIKLKDGLTAGLETIVSYKSTNMAIGALKSFEDVTIENPAHHDAYVNGFPDGTFRPQNTITRAEMAALLARNKGLSDQAAYQGLYPDVADGFWAAAYIEQLKELGLIIGDDKGKFRPADRITRAEMAMIVARWLKADLSTAKSASFSDVPANHWAATAIAIASEAGIMIGFEDGSFGMNELLTRAQAVTIMNRLLGRGPLTGVVDPTWPDVPATHWAYEQIEEASRDHDYVYLPDDKEKLYVK